MAFEKYQDLWSLKENSYSRLEREKAAVIFMDCKDVTGDHVRYHLMDKDPVYRSMAESAIQVAMSENLTCTVYAGIDEATVIFPDPGELYTGSGWMTAPIISWLFICRGFSNYSGRNTRIFL